GRQQTREGQIYPGFDVPTVVTSCRRICCNRRGSIGALPGRAPSSKGCKLPWAFCALEMDQATGVSSVIFGLGAAWVAAIIFVVTYLVIVAERINRSIIALLGAGLMVVCGVLTQGEAVRGIDFNTIALLTGMMILVSISRRCGMFEYLAIWSAKKGRAQPLGMLAMLLLVTALVSAFFGNVTTVLLIAPVTLSLPRQLEVPAYPFLFAEVFASNIGGTATLIGDPPNIMIGSAADLSFNDFIIHVAPVIAVVMAVQLVMTHLVWGTRLRATPQARER